MSRSEQAGMAEVAGAGRQRRSGAGAGRIGADRFLYGDELVRAAGMARGSGGGQAKEGEGCLTMQLTLSTGSTTTSSGCRLFFKKKFQERLAEAKPKSGRYGPGLGSKPWGGVGSQWTGTEETPSLLLIHPPKPRTG